MVPNFSIPLSGVQQAGWDIDRIAHRVASQGQGVRSDEENGTTHVLDPAADMTMLAQVENTAKANMRALSAQDDLAKGVLDLFD